MLLTKCQNITELISFLKSDYANNLYFFTYLGETKRNSDIEFLTAKYKDRIALALLLTPTHCCISTSNVDYIDEIAEQLPPINSIHVVGQKNLVEHLLKRSKGPKRNKHVYSLCEFCQTSISNELNIVSQKASDSDLNNLIKFYNNNDMLAGAAFRLPAILSWGKAYFVQNDLEIVSCALTTTETVDAAMIGAVYTTPGFRNNGYAKDCISSLCDELIQHHKKPYLFYESKNLMLCSLYESLGFRPINTWILATRI